MTNKSEKISRILLSDPSGKHYRLCSLLLKKDKFSEYFLKVSFPKLRFRPMTNANAKGRENSFLKMNEISFHYEKGVLTFKYGKEYARKLYTNQSLEKTGYLPLFTIELQDFLYLNEFDIDRKSSDDTSLQTVWSKPRGFFFIISKSLDIQLAVTKNLEILDVYNIKHTGTGHYIIITDYHLSLTDIQKSPMRIKSYVGTTKPIFMMRIKR